MLISGATEFVAVSYIKKNKNKKKNGNLSEHYLQRQFSVSRLSIYTRSISIYLSIVVWLCFYSFLLKRALVDEDGEKVQTCMLFEYWILSENSLFSASYLASIFIPAASAHWIFRINFTRFFLLVYVSALFFLYYMCLYYIILYYIKNNFCFHIWCKPLVNKPLVRDQQVWVDDRKNEPHKNLKKKKKKKNKT